MTKLTLEGLGCGFHNTFGKQLLVKILSKLKNCLLVPQTYKNMNKTQILFMILNMNKMQIGTVIVPIFDTKVTEYLCSGWVFFLQTNFDFLTSLFLTDFFLYHSKSIVVLGLNLKRYFTCDYFLYSYEGLKVAILTNLGQLMREKKFELLTRNRRFNPSYKSFQIG